MSIVLFRLCDHPIKFWDYLNKSHPIMKFFFEKEKNGKLSFVDVEVRPANYDLSKTWRFLIFWPKIKLKAKQIKEHNT